MPVSVKVLSFDSRRVTRLKRELEKLSTGSLFRSIPLADERRELEAYAESKSPEAKDNPLYYRNFLPRLGANMPFHAGWIVQRSTRGNSVVFTLKHKLENYGDEAVERFKAIEYGTSAQYVTASKDFQFKFWSNRRGKRRVSRRVALMQVSEGDELFHHATPQADVFGKTSEYLINVMLPRIGAKVDRLLRERLER